ncbi:MAG TPA: hypothetical protein DEH22_11915 [Chloroflexi bacterium]|nr:hypothetical protein [Chloroflexota bacterium]
MVKTLGLKFFIVGGTLLFLLLIPIKTEAGTPIDGSLVISEGTEQEVSPALAYNSQRQEYLAVWYNDRAGCDDIRAQRISKNGALVGGPFYISAGCTAERRYPNVAYNSASNQYLVVWEQYAAASGYSIRARRISGTGQVLDVNDLTIRSPGYNNYTPVKPAVSYASTSDRYLVIWAETWHPLPITYGIYGQVVNGAGGLDGNMFAVAEGNQPREEPDLAYNRHANRYLVVWQLDTGTLIDIHGQQVHGGGGLFQGDITIAYYSKSSTSPAVAALPTAPTDDKFLVVWELDYAPSDRDIYARLVAEDGSLGKDFWVSWSSGIDESSPAIAGSEINQQYFVTWRYPQGIVDKPIRGRAASYGGALLGNTAEFSGVAADLSSVAAGANGDFLVAWQDQPISATNTNLYGQLWGNRIYLPLVRRDHP